MQLSDVARPVIRLQERECIVGDAGMALAGSFAQLVRKVLREQRDILRRSRSGETSSGNTFSR